jgi:hypothetical protein
MTSTCQLCPSRWGRVACVQVGGLAGGSEVRAGENELRWSLAEYLFLRRNIRANTCFSALSALRRIASLSRGLESLHPFRRVEEEI